MVNILLNKGRYIEFFVHERDVDNEELSKLFGPKVIKYSGGLFAAMKSELPNVKKVLTEKNIEFKLKSDWI